MALHTDGGWDTYDEAISSAVSRWENSNVMYDSEEKRYHVIRLFAVEHWLQHYENVAEIRVNMVVKNVQV